MSQNCYDEIPYPSLTYADTHPDQLASLATLFAIEPPVVKTARILELGCGDGTNLIAIAQTLPDASLYGIDASAKQIKAGQEVLSAINCQNVTLFQLDFEAIDQSLGWFDYIIVHGVYSWISQPLQDKLLALIKQHLTNNGVAYISYNTLPGWHLDNIMRDMMMYHCQQNLETPLRLRIMKAKGILRFIAHLRQSGKGSYDILLQEKWQQLQGVLDNYIYHDFLEQDNNPIYFHQFISQIKQYDLNYVTDIEFCRYVMDIYPPDLVATFDEFFQDDFFKQEQYMDFFFNRSLRRSLLCHKNIEINRTIHWQNITKYYLATNLQTEATNLRNDEVCQFKKPNAEVVTVTSPIAKIGIAYLATHYPNYINFERLFRQVCKKLSISRPNYAQQKQLLAQELLQLYYSEAIKINVNPPRFQTKISNCPIVSSFSQWQVLQGEQNIANLICELVEISQIARLLLPHINGKNTQKNLLVILEGLVKTNKQLELLENNSKVILKQILAELSDKILLMPSK
ncbi:MAG: methyltransferase regulatory domain-containing protein [Thiomargarita sp.]|nr:methyltransferase regulatory domain-containing protein [Thiomargarita sp.]